MKIKYKIIILILSNIVMACLLIFLVIEPLSNKNEQLKEDIINNKGEVFYNQLEVESLLKAKQNFKNIDKSSLDYMFLSKDNTLFFIDSLEKLAANNNCDLNINLAEPQKINTHKEAALTLNFNSDLNNGLNFLKQIEEQNFYINYTDIKIQPSILTNNPENELSVNETTFNITAKTFWK